MSRPTALVTGGCGFVGRRFVRRLLRDGYAVTVVDDLSTGLSPAQWPAHLRIPPDEETRVEWVIADFRNYARTATADFDIVVHLAAVVGGRLTIEGDPLVVATDLAIDAVFFNWLVRAKPLPRKVIYFSSSAAYPIRFQTELDPRPLAEGMIDFGRDIGVPDLTYGWSKLTGEFLARQAVQKYALDVAIYRPFSGYGEDQDFSYPFPSVVRRVNAGENPIVVWGSGEQTRDFIYIEDIVDAVFETMGRLPSGEAINLGSGVATSFIALAQRAAALIGSTVRVVPDRTKPEGVFARVADCARMHRLYRPTTTLDAGIRLVLEYQRRAGLVQSRAPEAPPPPPVRGPGRA